MTDIVVPKVNTNDESYVLTDWLFADGQEVPADAAVAVLETSKATHELVAEQSGVLHRLVAENAECKQNDVIGRLFASAAERDAFLATERTAPEAAGPPADGLITDAAREEAGRHGIAESELLALGGVVRVGDVRRLVAERDGTADRVRPLSRHEQAVAAVVSEAHATVPAAFTAVKVSADRLRDVPPARPAEAVIKAIRQAYDEFPLFFGRLREGREVVLPDRIDIGVTIDAGHGLYLATVPDPAGLSLSQVAETLDRHHRSALTGSFLQADLDGSCIGLSVNTYTDVALVVPLIFPPHVAMVSIGGPQRELTLDRDGRPVTRTVFTLGVAYDHRVLGGRDAVRFLKHLKASVENRDRLQQWTTTPNAKEATDD
ncbi:2-oxo acid dehydrogenase subunit E2 [Actinoplanes sp. NPDC048796]|uniref:2-oxo acid dehydrogenase subunit E2 n=1 Tax=Actinoplanes sp. NPDC048796 TaxID=3155640 RepID=UPI003401111E